MHRPSVTQHVKQTVGRALGRVPSGVFILTVQHEGRSHAMMASWVQQASFEPPMLSVAIAKERAIGPVIRIAGHFALSVVGEGDTWIMKKYARGIASDADPFDDIATTQTPGGTPVLSDALAWLEFKLINVCELKSDHDLFIGEVTAGEVLKDGASFTHLRGSGFHY